METGAPTHVGGAAASGGGCTGIVVGGATVNGPGGTADRVGGSRAGRGGEPTGLGNGVPRKTGFWEGAVGRPEGLAASGTRRFVEAQSGVVVDGEGNVAAVMIIPAFFLTPGDGLEELGERLRMFLGQALVFAV